MTVRRCEVFELVLELAAAVDRTDVDARFAFRRVPGRLEAAAEGRVGELVQGREELDVGLEDRAGVRPQPGERIRDPGDPGVGRYVIGDVEIPFTTRRALILIFGVSIGSGSCPTRYGDHLVHAGRPEGGSGGVSSGRSTRRTPTGGGAQDGRRREVQRLSLRSSEGLEASDQALSVDGLEADRDRREVEGPEAGFSGALEGDIEELVEAGGEAVDGGALRRADYVGEDVVEATGEAHQ